ncbi:MAG: hypothetical protein IT221_04490 [Fluviicola sp.]|nr:hypothetical protein [Fluviicola sp.]
MKNIPLRIFSLFIFGVILFSCSDESFTLEQLGKDALVFEKQELVSPDNDFTLLIPKNWTWKTEDYGNKNILLAIDGGSPPDADGYIDIFSIQKIKSLGNAQTLEAAYKFTLNNFKAQHKDELFVESGKTDLLNYPAYFIHYKFNSGNYGETETFVFILESKEKGVYYHLIAGASQTKQLRKHLTQLIQTFKSFKLQESQTESDKVEVDVR